MIEEGQKLSIYLIKGYVSNKYLLGKNNDPSVMLKKSSTISNFKMGKRVTLELEYMPKHIEFYGSFFVIIYKKNT